MNLEGASQKALYFQLRIESRTLEHSQVKSFISRPQRSKPVRKPLSLSTHQTNKQTNNMKNTRNKSFKNKNLQIAGKWLLVNKNVMLLMNSDKNK